MGHKEGNERQTTPGSSKPKDRWDKLQIVAGIFSGLMSLIVAAALGYFTRLASQQIDLNNQHQTELTRTQLIRDTLDRFRSRAPGEETRNQRPGGSNITPSPGGLPTVDRELSRIALAGAGADAIPVLEMMLASSEPELQEDALEVERRLFLMREELRAEIVRHLIRYGDSLDPDLRRGVLAALEKIAAHLEPYAGDVLSFLDKRLSDTTATTKPNRAERNSSCVVLGRLRSARSVEILLRVIPSVANETDVQVTCIQSLIDLWGSLPFDGKQEQKWLSTLKNLNPAGWDPPAQERLAFLKTLADSRLKGGH
ncbi:MAG: hypothetical protein ABSD27_05680 [Bryobacteraceae bacterium]|jgi:hypothetical protein